MGAKPAKAHDSIFKPGTKGDYDPDHMAATTSHSELLGWVRSLLAAKDDRVPSPHGGRVPLFDEWHRRTIESIAKQVFAHEAQGRAVLATGRQIVVVKHCVNRLTAAVTSVLAV